MTDMMSGVENAEDSNPAAGLVGLDEQLITQLLSNAKASGLQLTGEGGALQQLTKRLLESALEGEITDHLGYDKHDPAGRGTGNSRDGTRSKTVLTDVGPVEIDMPRDRDASFEPKIAAKRQRRLGGVDEMVISLAAKGLTTGEISAHLAEVYGAEVSRQTISTITDKVIEGMVEWQNRPLDAVYPVIFIDAIHVKIHAHGVPEVVRPAARDLVDPADHSAHVGLANSMCQGTDLRLHRPEWTVSDEGVDVPTVRASLAFPLDAESQDSRLGPDVRNCPQRRVLSQLKSAPQGLRSDSCVMSL